MCKFRRSLKFLIALSAIGFVFTNLGCNAHVYGTSATLTPTGSQTGGSLQINPIIAQILPSELKSFSIQGGVPPYHMEIYSGGGSIDPSTGSFHAPASSGVSIIRVQDAAGATVYATVSSVNAPSISPSRLTLAKGNSFPFSVSGGFGPYTFSILSGVATIESTMGQFNATQANSVVVRVTDSLGRFSDSSVTVNDPLALSPKIVTANIRSSQTFGATGGVPPYHFRVLSGSGSIYSNGVYLAPDGPGIDVIQVQDSFGNSDLGVVHIHSNLSLGPSSSLIAQGTSMMMTASGGIPPYTYSSEVGILTSEGLFTAPESSGGPYLLTATDSAGNTALATVTVVPSISFSVQNLTLPVNGVFDFAAITQGGVGGKTYAVPGSQGTFVGSQYTAPSTPGTYFVNVYDSQSPLSNSATAVITVNPALTLTPSSTDLAVTNTESFSVSGGVPPYTFSMQSGSGEIDSNGTYTAGTGAGSAVVQVLDSFGSLVTSSITIEPELQIIPSSKVMNTESSFQFNTSGGVGQKTYTLISGAGNLHPTTGVFSAPSSAGSSAIRVADERGNARQANISMVSPLQLLPTQVPILVGTTFPLVGSGGAAPYTYLLSGPGLVDAQGVFTAPGTAGLSTVEIRDALGNTQTSVITVYDGLLLLPFGKTLVVNQVLSFQASGGVAPYRYQKVSGGGSINSSTGVYSAPSTPDTAVVQVTDALGKTSQANLTIQPRLSLSPTSVTLGIGNSTSFSASGGVPPYAYLLTSGPGTLDSSTGVYQASSSGSAQVQVTDSDGTTASATVTVQAGLSLSSSATELAPNSTAQLSALGGVPPYTLSFVSGSGNLDSSTRIYTSPNTAASAVIRVTDSLGNFAEISLQTYSALSLSPPSRVLAIQTQASFSASGGKLPYTFSVSPDGGVISSGGLYAAPTTSGSAIVQVTDALGQSRQSTITITDALSISPSQVTLAASGSRLFSGAGGVGPYTFTLYSGAGTLSGGIYTGPASGGTLAIVRVTDSYGSTADATVTVNDIPPTSLGYSSSAAIYIKNVLISSLNPISSGGAVVTYAISPALPAGLKFGTLNGVISGTPTAVSVASNYTITATNSGGSATATVNLTVNDVAPSSLTYSNNPAIYSTGVSVSNYPSSSGGDVISYSVSPSLPAGLSLNLSNGMITGTPSGPSSATPYVITGTNSGGSAIVSLNIAIAGPLIKAPPTQTLKTPGSSIASLSTPTLTISGIEKGSEVKIYVDDNTCSGSYVKKQVAPSTSPVDITLPAFVSDRTYQIYSKYTDIAGIDSPCSSALSYTLDTQFNTITLTLSVPANSPSAISTPTVVVNPVEAGSTVNVYKDSGCSGELILTDTSAATSRTLTLPSLGSSEKTYTLSAIYQDLALNTSNCASLSYTLDPTPPVIPSPVPKFTSNTYNSFNMSWSPATDLTGVTYRAFYTTDPSILTQAYDSNNISVAGLTVSPAWSTSTSWAVSGLTNGTTYYAGVIAMDAVGNKSAYSFTATYTKPIQTSTTTLPVAYYDAAFRNGAYGGTPCTSGSPTPWTDLGGANRDAAFPAGYACSTSSGWKGDGTADNLYRVTLDGGANSHIETPISADPASMPNSTWEVWVRPVSMSSHRQQIISNDNSSFGRSLLIEVNTAGFYFFVGISPNIVLATAASLSNWQHMAISFDSSFNMVVYKNGTSVKTSGGGGQVSNKKLMIGDNSGGPGTEPFMGDIGMVTIFDKVLTANEVKAHCQSQKIRFDSSLCP